MNPLGVHALVFAGSWSKKDRERAVAGAARLASRRPAIAYCLM